MKTMISSVLAASLALFALNGFAQEPLTLDTGDATTRNTNSNDKTTKPLLKKEESKPVAQEQK